MHHAVSHRSDRGEYLLRFEPIQKKSYRRMVIIHFDGATVPCCYGRVFKCQSHVALTEAIHLTNQPRPQRFDFLIERKPDARRTTVAGE